MPTDEPPTEEPQPPAAGGRERPSRDDQTEEAKKRKSSTRNAVEWVAVMVAAVLVALAVRTFLFQTFYIPSISMAETLHVDDRVLVNKLAYKFGDVHRGDVVVFERPQNDPAITEKDLIKRVIAVAGDRVSITEGTVKVNGKQLDEPYTSEQPTELMTGCGPGEVTGLDTAGGMKIPAGTVLVLGDNRTHSHDGRCFGPIDEDLIVGRAFALIWPPSRTGGL
ncbi:MAG: signal peptidase [Acidimicrobiales bacterium]|nr:signal peptidase [Acidimicrobiales bacterium]